jgi:hypothetical protein
MHARIPAILFAVAAGLCWVGPAEAAQEFSCTGPQTVTGKAIGPTTLTVAGFECAGAPQPFNALGDRAASQGASVPQSVRRAPFVVADFKGPAPAIKVGDTVTLKGQFSVVADSDHQLDYVVISGAEIVN